MPFGFGRRRKDEETPQRGRYHMQSVAFADGPEDRADNHLETIMGEIENALRTKRQFRYCLARLLKKDE